MRGIRSAPLVAAAVLAASLPRGALATPIFLLDTDEATYALIHRVNPQSGQLITLGSLPAADEVVVALAAQNDDVLYAVSWRGSLLRITLSPFRVTTVGDVGQNQIVGLAMSGGVLYATSMDDMLERIDPTTGARTEIGTIRVGGAPLDIYGGDLAQGADGTWFLWTNSTQALYTLDLTTAVATPVPAQVATNTYLSGLAVDYGAGGTLYGAAVDLDELDATDPRSGAAARRVPLCRNCPARYDLALGDLASPRCSDADADGFSAEGGPCGPVDCNDANAAVNPRATEACNGRDDDCDGVVDDGANAACNDGNACTIGDSCQSGACRPGPSRDCRVFKLIGVQCRPSDGACCGRLGGGLLPGVTVCRN
jgi:hypothetical protein